MDLDNLRLAPSVHSLVSLANRCSSSLANRGYDLLTYRRSGSFCSRLRLTRRSDSLTTRGSGSLATRGSGSPLRLHRYSQLRLARAAPLKLTHYSRLRLTHTSSLKLAHLVAHAHSGITAQVYYHFVNTIGRSHWCFFFCFTF